jgi:hypothetical protein
VDVDTRRNGTIFVNPKDGERSPSPLHCRGRLVRLPDELCGAYACPGVSGSVNMLSVCFKPYSHQNLNISIVIDPCCSPVGLGVVSRLQMSLARRLGVLAS